MQTTVKAGGDIFIMLIVGLFWVVAQIAGGAAKKKMPTQPFSDDEESGEAPVDPPALSNVDGFADLMRKLSGGQEFEIPPPPAPPLSQLRPKPVEVSKPRWNSNDLDDPPKPQAAMAANPVMPSLEKPSMPEPAPAMSAFRKSMPTLKMPTMDLNFQTLEKTGGNFPTFGKIIDPADRKSVRRAMLSHIIFSEPKAMEGWNARHAG